MVRQFPVYQPNEGYLPVYFIRGTFVHRCLLNLDIVWGRIELGVVRFRHLFAFAGGELANRVKEGRSVSSVKVPRQVNSTFLKANYLRQ